MGKKILVDARAKREYRKVLQSYGSVLNDRINEGKIDEERFWFLQDKLSQWYDNYRPIMEVDDFTRI